MMEIRASVGIFSNLKKTALKLWKLLPIIYSFLQTEISIKHSGNHIATTTMIKTEAAITGVL